MSPRSKEQFEEIRQRSRQTIKEAALELFGHQGYHSTSISQIAKEAGVSKGLLYNYFESKEALLEEILMDAVETGEEIMAEIIQQANGPVKVLRGMIETTFAFVQDNLHYWKLLLAVAFQAGVLEDHVPKLKHKQIENNERFIELFRKMGFPDAEREALAFSAIMDGIFVQYIQMEDQYPLEIMKQYLLERYCS